MLALAVPVARLVQFAGAMGLAGAPLFYLYGLSGAPPSGARRMQWVLAALTLLAAVVQLSAQTAAMTCSPGDALSAAALWSVLSGTEFGRGVMVRLVLVLSLIGALLPPAVLRQGRWLKVQAAFGAAVVASFAWTGHGVADEGAAGAVHLLADIAHLLAAAVWIGALAALSLVLLAPAKDRDLHALHSGLAGFSGVGTGVVAVLIATGLVNSWFLIGPAHIADFPRTAYGLVLLAKLAFFVLMLAAAAANRFRLTPRLAVALGDAQATAAAVQALRLSILIETGLALGVLVAVAWLGVLAPPISD